MPLTHSNKKRQAKKDKAYKILDEKGMLLLIKPNGGKYFRLNYRMHGKQKTLALGVYPDTSLAKAREKRDIARKQIAEGEDPMAIKKIEKNLFKDIALKWFKSKQRSIEESTHKKKLRRFYLHVFPVIGYFSIGDVV